MAKTSNLWRAPGNAKIIFNAWVQYTDRARACDVAKTLPPRALRGRWGSIANLEKKVDRCGRQELHHVFHTALRPTRKAAPAEAGALAVDSDDEREYEYKLGKWSAQVLEAVKSDEMWLCLAIAKTTRTPVVHLEHWLEKHDDRTHVLQLVCGRLDSNGAPIHDSCPVATSIYNEWTDMCCESALGMWHVIFDDLSYGEIGTQRQHEWVAVGVACILEMACDFFNRVVAPSRVFPRLLMWLVWKPHGVPCNERQSCVADLLGADEKELDNASLKLRMIFALELQHAAATGLLPEMLWRCISDVSTHWIPHTQDIEGANSTIKAMVTIAPNIKWPLLSSRSTLRKMRSHDSSVRELIVEECVRYHKAFGRSDLLILVRMLV